MSAPHDDPYYDVAYQEFVSSMVEHCHCCERNRPCEGVLAGGICDGVKESEPEDLMAGRDEDDE